MASSRCYHDSGDNRSRDLALLVKAIACQSICSGVTTKEQLHLRADCYPDGKPLVRCHHHVLGAYKRNRVIYLFGLPKRKKHQTVTSHKRALISSPQLRDRRYNPLKHGFWVICLSYGTPYYKVIGSLRDGLGWG